VDTPGHLRIVSDNEQNRSSSDRTARIQALVEECLRTQAAGEVVSDQTVIDSHPALMPELGQELKKLRLIGAARGALDADTDHWSPETTDHVRSDSGSGRLEVRCPQCHTPMELAADTALTDLTCESCGSHFSLVDNTKSTRTAEALTTMGRFELVERLGMGGFGTVWKARDKELDRTVAIKIPRQGEMTAEEMEKFFREARAAAQLRHPNIVNVHEVGRDGDSVYIVSTFVRGVTLGDWLTGQQLTNREAAELCNKIAEALHHAHEQGVIHRDLKPANIMMDLDGQPHLMDFGLARREIGEVTMTIEGQVLGTPSYMSPEQAQGESHAADRRSDVYSLGVILFQLLTGELPFRGNARMLMYQVIREEAPSPRKLNSNVPKDLETITLKCLEKELGKRYQTAQELADELGRFLTGEPIHARPIGPFSRGWRWCKRKPMVAGLAAAVVFLLVAGTAISSYFAIAATIEANRAISERLRADKNAENERLARAVAQEATARAEMSAVAAQDEAKRAQAAQLRAERLVYAADMNLAQSNWEGEDGSTREVLRLLERHRPGPGEEDLRGWEWFYQWRLCHNDLRTLKGHSSTVESVVFSPDGTRLASASSDGTVKLWDPQSGTELRTLKGHSDRVRSVAFSPDGTRLASASDDGTVKLWDPQSGTELRTLKGHSGTVESVAFSPDGTRLASASWDETVKLWDPQSGTELRTLKGHSGTVESVAFSPDGTRLASASWDETVKLWDATLLTSDEKMADSLFHQLLAESHNVEDVIKAIQKSNDWSPTVRAATLEYAQQRLDVQAAFQDLPSEKLQRILALIKKRSVNTDGVVQAVAIASQIDIEAELTPLQRLVHGEILLVGNEPQRALKQIRRAIDSGGNLHYYYKSLGWALYVLGERDAAKEAFQQTLKSIGRFIDARESADPDHWTAAYFLDQIGEDEYASRWRKDNRYGETFACFPWFYIGLRAEADGRKSDAVRAYRKCVELGHLPDAHHNSNLAAYRLQVLGETAEAPAGRTDSAD